MENSSIQSTKPINFLKLNEVIKRVGLKHSTIYKRISVGKFPEPVSLGGRAVAWVEHEIEGWMIERMNERSL